MELATFRSQVHRANHCTTALPLFIRLVLLEVRVWNTCYTTNANQYQTVQTTLSHIKDLYNISQVKLYTKQGSLKYQTDCAPNNGYYMIPVYDKGDYLLKVEPPPGWTFGKQFTQNDRVHEIILLIK